MQSTGSLSAAYPTPASSVGRMILDRVAATPDGEALRGPPPEGGWRSRTWREVGVEAVELAAGLVALGVEPEDRVGIVSGTRSSGCWPTTRSCCAGGATTTVYPTTQPEDIGYILCDSGTRVLFAEDMTQIAKLEEERDRCRTWTTSSSSTGKVTATRLIVGPLRARGRDLLAAHPGAVTRRVDATVRTPWPP